MRITGNTITSQKLTGTAEEPHFGDAWPLCGSCCCYITVRGRRFDSTRGTGLVNDDSPWARFKHSTHLLRPVSTWTVEETRAPATRCPNCWLELRSGLVGRIPRRIEWGRRQTPLENQELPIGGLSRLLIIAMNMKTTIFGCNDATRWEIMLQTRCRARIPQHNSRTITTNKAKSYKHPHTQLEPVNLHTRDVKFDPINWALNHWCNVDYSFWEIFVPKTTKNSNYK